VNVYKCFTFGHDFNLQQFFAKCITVYRELCKMALAPKFDCLMVLYSNNHSSIQQPWSEYNMIQEYKNLSFRKFSDYLVLPSVPVQCTLLHFVHPVSFVAQLLFSCNTEKL
jgi:hypothetical protein